MPDADLQLADTVRILPGFDAWFATQFPRAPVRSFDGLTGEAHHLQQNGARVFLKGEDVSVFVPFVYLEKVL